MLRFFLSARKCRAMAAVAASLAAAAFLAGCSPANRQYPPETESFRSDASPIHAACEAMCLEDTALALVTRTGCLAGCEEARNRFPLQDKFFTDRRDCLDALLHEELSREKRIAEMKLWCDARWSHVHNRKGCYLAAERFYAPFPPEDICAGGPVRNALYGERLKKAAKEAENPPAGPANAETERPDQTGPQPHRDPASHTVQPAGPFDPPPYVAAPVEGAGQKPAEPKNAPPAAAAVPEIHDTPKYQKTAPKKTSPAEEEKPTGKDSPASGTPAPQTPSTQRETGAIADAPAPPLPAAPTPPSPAAPDQSPPPPVPGPQPTPARPEPALPERGEQRAPAAGTSRPAPLENAQEAKRPGPPARTPPVPSMLDKPYETPAIISPQIDMPGG